MDIIRFHEVKALNIGILTYYFANNYGAVLQCYALQEYLEKEYGANVSVITYNPPRMNSYRSRISGYIRNHKQYTAFEDFRKRYLHLSNSKEYDLVLVGSDQVWNPSINGFDDAWISPHLSYKGIASYAASLGKEEFDQRERQYLEKNKDALKAYKGISVREKDGQTILGDLEIKSNKVCDPVFLLSMCMNKYDSLKSQSKINIEDEYILVYSLEHNPRIDEVSQRIKRETGMKVVSIHPANAQTQVCDAFISDSGPCDFLRLIQDASLVVTNSFHGLAFSLLFKKKCYSIFHSSGLSSRQMELCRYFCGNLKQTEEDMFVLDNFEYDKQLNALNAEARVFLDSIMNL